MCIRDRVYTQEVILNIDWECSDYDPINPYEFIACERTNGKTLSSLSTLTVDGLTFILDESLTVVAKDDELSFNLLSIKSLRSSLAITF